MAKKDPERAERPEPLDGRRLRRERGREAVLCALEGLLAEGVTPTADVLAERAGVSASSLFRYFASLDDLQQEVIERHLARSEPLFEVPRIGQGNLPDRIDAFVDARLTLYEAIAPIARPARRRAVDQPVVAATLQQTRSRLAAQVDVHFAVELDLLGDDAAGDLSSSIAALTSFEAWDLLTTSQHRSRHQLARAWRSAMEALLGPR